MRKGTCCVMRGNANESKKERDTKKRCEERNKIGAAMIYWRGPAFTPSVTFISHTFIYGQMMFSNKCLCRGTGMLKSFLNEIFYIIHSYSFIQSFSMHNFSLYRGAWRLSQHALDKGKGKQPVHHINRPTCSCSHSHPQAMHRVFSSCYLHLFGQWKECGAFSISQRECREKMTTKLLYFF